MKKQLHPDSSRRAFLRACGCLGLALAAPSALARPEEGARHLRLHNLHTGEKVLATYWEKGVYIADERAAIDRVLRDHRSGDVHPIDPKLLDALWRLQQRLDIGGKPFMIISGYRSPKTNAALRQKGGGVAKKSFHMEGRAIDIRVPNRPLDQVYDAALAMQAGGVGYYAKSNFVHLDIGRVRRWRG